MSARIKRTWRSGGQRFGYEPSRFDGNPWMCQTCGAHFPSLHAAREHQCISQPSAPVLPGMDTGAKP